MFFKTEKEASKAGHHTDKEWLSSHRVPVQNAKSTIVKGEKFYSKEQTEPVISKTEGKRRRLRLKGNAQPAAQLYWGYKLAYHYPAYRLTDFEPMRSLVEIPPTEIDLLLAIWTVNRSAKRYRDAARIYYCKRIHGFAQSSKWKKMRLYTLKEAGIREAFKQGLLVCEGIRDEFGCFTGGGFYFHSRFIPEGDYPVDTNPLLVESKPKAKAEARLKDAIFTLEQVEQSRNLENV